jgi:hypothetical protein
LEKKIENSYRILVFLVPKLYIRIPIQQKVSDPTGCGSRSPKMDSKAGEPMKNGTDIRLK